MKKYFFAIQCCSSMSFFGLTSSHLEGGFWTKTLLETQKKYRKTGRLQNIEEEVKINTKEYSGSNIIVYNFHLVFVVFNVTLPS